MIKIKNAALNTALRFLFYPISIDQGYNAL